MTLPPIDRDEPRFAQATKQMIETGDFVAIRFQGEARNKKPVGIYWLQAGAVAAARSLGFDATTGTIWLYRLPSLLGAVAAVLLTFWTGLAFATRRAAFLAALLFAGTALIGFEARLAKTDAVLTATVVAAMGALARAMLARNAPALGGKPIVPALVFWTAMAAGILVKGPITPMIVVLAIIGAVIATRGRSDALGSWLSTLRPGLGLLWCLLLVAPWFALILVKTGGAFLTDSVGKDMLGKVASGQELHGAPPGSYLLAFVVTAWPLAPFAVLAASFAWRDRREPSVLLLLAWLVPNWLLFEAVPTKLPHYVLPLYPAIAILAAMALERGEAVARHRALRAIVIALTLLVPLGIPAAALVLARIYVTPLSLGFLFLVAAILIATFLAIWALRRDLFHRISPIAAIPPLILVAALLDAALFGQLGSGPSFAPFAISPRLVAAARAAAKAEGCGRLQYATTSYREPSLVFLTSTELQMTDAEGAARFLAGGTCRIAFVEAREEEAFRAALAAAPVALASRVQGVNLNSGRRLDIGVYIHGGAA